MNVSTRRSARRSLMAVGLCVLFAAGARAQTGEWKVPPAGTIIEWNEDGRQSAVKILGSNGFQVNQELFVEGASRGFRDKYAGLQNLQTVRGEIVRFDRSKLEALWPLQVGKAVALDVSYGQGNSVYNIKVVGYEKVSVPAGTFDAFVIEWQERLIGYAASYNPYAALYRYWWVPALGYHVKFENRVTGGINAGRVTRGEVTAIKTSR